MKIKFLVDSYQSSIDSFCSLRIFENDQEKYFVKECVHKDLEFEFDINTNSTIDFVVSNKDPQHTIVKDKTIVKDTYLHIKKIFIGEYDVLPKVNLFSNYFTKDYGVLHTNGFMNYNGTYRFKFRYPLSNHILLCRYYEPKA